MLKRIGAISLAALLVVILSGVPFVGAEPATVTCNVKQKLSLTLSTANIPMGDVDPETPSEINASAGLYAIRSTVKANGSWGLNYSATNFTTASYTMPIGRLGYKLDGDAAYTNMTTTGGTLKTGSGTSGVNYDYDYKLTPDWTDPVADGYGATVTYTLVAQ